MKTAQKLVVLILVIIVLVVIAGLVRAPKVVVPQPEPVVTTPVTTTVQSQDICFYSEKRTDATHADIAWLKATVTGGMIKGELRNLPAEKDSKIGLFEGTISATDIIGVQKVDAIWQTRAEGMETPEQLILKISSDKAEVGFGEMVDSGDGVYVYKTPDAIPYFSSIPSVPCSELNEHITVEKYIRDNIGSLTSAKAKLGGKWYVTTLLIDQGKKSGSVSYEDGHIQKTSAFTYSVDSTNKITITGIK